MLPEELGITSMLKKEGITTSGDIEPDENSGEPENVTDDSIDTESDANNEPTETDEKETE